MLFFILFLPMVMGFDYYYLINKTEDFSKLECGISKNISWFKSQNGAFINMMKSNQSISIRTRCLEIYYCEYEKIYFDEFIIVKDLFFITCKADEMIKFQHLIDQISNKNFYLLISFFVFLIISLMCKIFINKIPF